LLAAVGGHQSAQALALALKAAQVDLAVREGALAIVACQVVRSENLE